MIRGIFRSIVGLIFGLLAMLALMPALAAFTQDDTASATGGIAWLVVLAGGALGFFARTIRKAFGRGFLFAGLAVLALPLSTMLLSGRVTRDMVSGAEAGAEGATAVGSGIAAVMMTGASAVIGLFLGGILIIIGLVLVLGGRREVVIVREGGSA